LLYYALQVYVDAGDWPNNNIEMWRYSPTDDERSDTSLHPFLRDGKWRFVAQDMDVTWNMYGRPGAGNDRTTRDTIHGLLYGQGRFGGQSIFLKAVLARADMRVKFAEVLEELIDGAFAPDNAVAEIDRLTALNAHEVKISLLSDKLLPDNTWPTLKSIEREQEDDRYFALNRGEFMRKCIEKHLRK
ncbi:MAG: CotH kinase family protein, partial [Oscillospiraceae bacterium]|nr:CotH kinase family protein [Oscillospiraceae bacterium]